jgi:Deacetylase PdaC
MSNRLYLLTFAPALFLTAVPSLAALKAAAPLATPAAVASNVDEKSEAFEFSYRYPAEAAAIPKLASWLNADRTKSRKELAGWAKDGLSDAKANAYAYHPYSQGTGWTVVGDNGAFLSLAGTFDNYTGGAHGNYGFRFLLWDKKAAKVLRDYGDVFVKGNAALGAIRQDYCAALDKERAEKRGAEWEKEPGSLFDTCPSFADLVIGFSGKVGQPLDTVEMIAGPYVAGSYAEGAYEIALPVSKALLAAIKPQYRSAFIAR